VIRYSLFFVLLLFRSLTSLFRAVIAPLLLISGLAFGALQGWQSTPCLVLLAVSLELIVVTFLYDVLLAWLGPDGMQFHS
jgi:hypothetical protein